ncbi:MAG: UbiD family decarboxylase [Nitrospinota bacterium]
MGEDLRSFWQRFEKERPEEVIRISEPVRPDFLPTAVAWEAEALPNSPAVFLEKIEGFDHPVIFNLFGTRERVARTAGTTREIFGEKWLQAEESPLAPVSVPSGPAQEVILEGKEVDVTRLPILHHFPQDAGRYLCLGMFLCRDPDTGISNLSYHRMQMKGPDRFGVSLHSRGHPWDFFRRQEERGKSLEVAIVIGAHPALHVAAGAEVGMDVDEIAVAGALLGSPVEMVPCKSLELEAPANAEIILEGEILPHVREPEGPFNEYTGYTTSRSTENVFQVKTITRKRDAWYLDVIPGYSSEHLLLSRVSKEARVFKRLKEAVPTLKAMNCPKSGTLFHAYISLKKTAEGMARHALMLLMGLDHYIKLAVAVDEDIDVYNEEEVLWAMATRMQADKDVFIVPGDFMNRLDPSSPDGTAAKMGVDATAPLGWDVERVKIPPEILAEAKGFLNRAAGNG